MTISNMIRLERLKKALSSETPRLPNTMCRMHNGEVVTFSGLDLLQPFMDGEIISMECDNDDIAHLLRALDDDHAVQITLVCDNGGEITRESI